MLRLSILFFATVLVAKVSSQCVARDPVSDCVVYDGTHVKTFDGKVYSVTSNCGFTIASIPGKNLQINYLKNPTKLQIVYKGLNYVISFIDGRLIYTLDGVTQTIPSTRSGVTVSQPGEMAIVELKALGIKLRYNGDTVEMIQDNQNNSMVTSGLCGNNDGCNNNELIRSDGQSTTAVLDWAISWALNGCTQVNNFKSSCGSNVGLLNKATTYCDALFQKSQFASCSPYNSEFMNICCSNYCDCVERDIPDCQCSMLDAFVRTCQTKTNTVIKWRTDGVCTIECKNPFQFYEPCAPNRKQLTCGEQIPPDPNRYDCEEGCYCTDEYRWFEGKCVRDAECPCFEGCDMVDGCPLPDLCRRYGLGAVITRKCYDCTCVAGGYWDCPGKKCCCVGAHCCGDPHYLTFDGQKYDFMGKCNYYLMRGIGFDVICHHYVFDGRGGYKRDFTSAAPSLCIKVEVHYNEHVIMLGQNKVVDFDGRRISTVPFKRGGIRIANKDSQFITVFLRNGVEISFNGIYYVHVDIPMDMIHRVKGLLGTYTLTTADDYTKPDGSIAANPNDFGHSWKVPGSCENEYVGPVDHPCDVNPTYQTTAQQFCQHIQGTLFAGCSDTPADDYENCVYDGCLCLPTDPNCLCEHYQVQAKKCAAKGISVNWRATITQCALTCPAGQTYQHCGNSCQRSCMDISQNIDCIATCADGCSCPPGQTLNDNNQCIPISQCNCIYNDLRFPPGFTFVIEEEGLRYDCVNGVWEITDATIQDFVDYPSVEQFDDECSPAELKGYSGCKRTNTLTCYNKHLEEPPNYDNCVAGCECLDGFVFDEVLGICVRPEHCPCLQNDISYPDNSVIWNRDQKCTCLAGEWVCNTETGYSATCSAIGDGHIRTFDSTIFSFDGVCEYVLFQYDFGTGGSFRITLETGFCDIGSCIAAVYLRYRALNGDIENIVFAPGQSMVGLNLQNLIVTDLGPSIVVDVVGLGLRIVWGQEGWVHIHAAENWLTWPFYGLCSSYDNNPDNDLEVPGVTLNSVADFVNYNQLDNTCDGSTELIVEDVILPDTICEYLFGGVFQTCNFNVPPQKYFERCFINYQRHHDAQQPVSNDYYCDVFSAYAQECNNAQTPVDWRTANICPLQCATGKTHYPCDTPCPRVSCSFPATACTDRVCTESCNTPQCPPGQVYSDTTYTQCIDPAQCPTLRRSSLNTLQLLWARARG